MVKRYRGEVRCFVPAGRSCPALYAVTLKDQPGVVKVGRTNRWTQRRKAYADWNLRRGDGIDREVLFEIHDEWCDLEEMEAQVLRSMNLPLRHGFEWFVGSLEAAVDAISAVLEANECFYTEQRPVDEGEYQ